MDTLLPRTLLALCLLLSACKQEKTPDTGIEKLLKYSNLKAQAAVHESKSEYPEELASLQQALALCDKVAAADEWNAMATEIARIQIILGETEKQEADYRETLAKNDEEFGEYSPESLESLRGLVAMLWRQGKRVETEKGLRRLVAAAEVLLARNIPEDPDTESKSRLLSGRLGLLGNFLIEAERYGEAELLMRTSLQLECDYLQKIGAMNSELHFQTDIYHNVLLKLGDTEEQAQEKILKMMEPLTKK